MPIVDDEGNKIPEATPGTGSSDASGGTGESGVQSFDISGLPFKFNPPLHKSLRFIRTNLGEGAKNSGVKSFYDETNNKYEASFAMRKDEGKTGFENLRLGRIIMDDMAVSKGVIEGGKRFGFRFLYNPAQLGGSLNVGTDFIPNQQSAVTVVLQKGLENMQLEVLLNRIPDITGNAKISDYSPNITESDRKRLQEQGTQYDLDYLYRCANGVHNTRQRSQTGDIGVLLPNPCRLILGPYTSRGAVVQVSVSDQMFSGDMVPVLSYVNITFARFLNMAQSEIARAQSYGMAQDDGSGGDGSNSDSSSDGGSSSGGSSGGSPGGTLSGKQVWQLAVNAGFSSGQADVMTQIAKKESGWYASAHNGNSGTGDNSYGLWQINMLGSMGPSRRRQFGISKNEDLFHPATNAQAARKIYQGSGYRAWSTYKNGSYRNVSIDWR